jgi:hypothetical protein
LDLGLQNGGIDPVSDRPRCAVVTGH